jgi:subtilisin family serine protease
MMRFALSLFACLALLVAAASPALAGDVRVVVNFKGHGQASAAAVKQAGGHVHRTLHDAVAADLSPAAIAKLRADPRVASVEEDGVMEVCAPRDGKGKPTPDPEPDPEPDSQVLPWGVERVGAPGSNTGAHIKVAVIDTGIDLKHPDLHVEGDVSFVARTGSGKDDHGHGTHVSGSIAALDNDIGVIGVAPDALLYAVKVLDRRGSGYQSDVALGIRWAADNGMHVANMSLGGGHSTVLQNACWYARDEGVLLVAAAGNSGDGKITTAEISHPAGYLIVVAVAATKSGNALASFSNSFPISWDPDVTTVLDAVSVAAPGVSIRSTLKGGGYGLKNGTSMASPHAAGVAALLWRHLVDPGETYVHNTVDMTTVRYELGQTTLDLGHVGWDTGFGSGLVQVPPK